MSHLACCFYGVECGILWSQQEWLRPGAVSPWSALSAPNFPLITEFSFPTKLWHFSPDFRVSVLDYLFLFLFFLFSGSQAAGAAGCQHPGREDGEQDADGGDWTWHGQHHLSELHGLPGGNSQGKYSLQRHRDYLWMCTYLPAFFPKTKQLRYVKLKFCICRNGQRSFSTLCQICWFRTHPARPALRKRM